METLSTGPGQDRNRGGSGQAKSCLEVIRPSIFAVPRTRRSGGTGRRAGFRSQWAQARGGSSPPFGMRKTGAGGRELGADFTRRNGSPHDTGTYRSLLPAPFQYLGKLGSTFTAQASIPPRRLRTFEKPAALRISSALSERAPWWQCVTISR